MKRLLFACLLLALVPARAGAALNPGEPAPDFATQASFAGKAFDYSLHAALEKGPVVVYFYPSAFTPGCNVQARAFATHLGEFAAAGASVVGVSLDGIERLNDFSRDPEYCAGKFPVASDPDGSIARSFELTVVAGKPGQNDTRGVAIGHDFAERTTFIVGQDGRIEATIGGVSPEENVRRALLAIRALSASP